MYNSTSEKKLIRYLIPDLEYRRDNSGNWILCQIAFRGLNRRFEHSFCHNAYFVESLKCPKFVAETVERDFDNEASYVGNLRSPEEYLKVIFHALQLGRDGNIELVGHNINSVDLPSLENWLHQFGYPFWWNDHEFENGCSKEGLFCHNIHDTRQIGEEYRALLNSYNIKTKVTLRDTADIFGIPVNEERLHDASYDCWLTEQIFIRDKEEKAFSTYFKNICQRAANPMDYANADLNVNAAKNDDYYEVPDEDYHTETFVQPESEFDDYEEIFTPPEKKKDK